MTAQTVCRLNDGNEIPQLGFGTYKLRGDSAYRLTLAAIEAGYRHIDTASYYDNAVEVGRAIADSGVDRGELFVTSKLWPSEYADPEAALSAQLAQLNLDRLDLYLVHWPVPTLGTAWGAYAELLELRQRGLTRSVGVSNFSVAHLRRVIDDTGVVPAVNQIELHPEYPRNEVREFCRGVGTVVEAWCPLARARDSLFQAETVSRLARRYGKTPAQIVLRWHLQRDTVVIPKTATEARVAENADIFDFELDAEAMAALDALDQGGTRGRIGGDPELFTGLDRTG